MYQNNSPINQIKNISNISKGTVKIAMKDGSFGSGCFLKLERNKKPFYCLITNQHVINSEMVEKKEKITIYYDNEKKKISVFLNRDKRVIVCFQEVNNLDVIIIEMNEGKINDKKNNYFLTPNMNYSSPFEKYKDKDIQLIQYPLGGNLSYSEGKILTIKENMFLHNSSTQEGSSGSPIVFKGEETVIAIHRGATGNHAGNVGIFIKDIVEIMKDFSKKNLKKNNNHSTIKMDNLKKGISIMADFIQPMLNAFDTCPKCKCETENHDKIDGGILYCQRCDNVCEL